MYKLCSDVCICLTNFHLRNHPLRVADRSFYLRLLQDYVSRGRESEARTAAKRQRRTDKERVMRSPGSVNNIEMRSSGDIGVVDGTSNEPELYDTEIETLPHLDDPFHGDVN